MSIHRTLVSADKQRMCGRVPGVVGVGSMAEELDQGPGRRLLSRDPYSRTFRGMIRKPLTKVNPINMGCHCGGIHHDRVTSLRLEPTLKVLHILVLFHAGLEMPLQPVFCTGSQYPDHNPRKGKENRGCSDHMQKCVILYPTVLNGDAVQDFAPQCGAIVAIR
jgi:hypothetical protein